MSQTELPRTLGLRHLALSVKDSVFDATLVFYKEAMGMGVDWHPDVDNIYLSGGADNLALHRVADSPVDSGDAVQVGALDHLGFLCPDAEAVRDWYARLSAGARAWEIELLGEPRLHRDGATSFYLLDPAGHKVQIVHIVSVVA